MIDTTGMSPEDAARVAASDANARGIEQGRRRAARALVAPPAPLAVVKAAWKPFLDAKRRGSAGGGTHAAD